MSIVRAFQVFQISRQAVFILISVLLAKSSLSATDIGTYELLMYVGYALTFFWISGLIQSLLVSYKKLTKDEQSVFLVQIYGLLTAAAGVIFLLLNLFEIPITKFLTNQSQLPHFQLFSAYLLFQIPAYLVENIYLLKQRAKWIVGYAGITSILNLLLVILPVFYGYGLGGAIWGLLILAIIKHFWLLAILLPYGTWIWQPKMIRPWVITALPLMSYAFISSFALTFDNWLVNWWYQGDAKQFAIFRYGARELPLALAMANAFSTAMLPAVAENLPQSLLDIKNKSRKLFHLLFPISILGLLVAYPFFPIIFSETFTESAAIFNVYLLILISRLVFPHTIIIGLGEGSFMTKVSIIELIINVLASIILVKYLGLVGIAFGTVIAYSFEKVAHVWYLQHYHQISFWEYVDGKWFVGYSLLLSSVYLLMEFFN